MQRMIEDLLAYARAGGQREEVTAVDWEALLATGREGSARAIAESRATITHDPLPTVQATPPT